MRIITKDKLNPAALARAYDGAAFLDEVRPGWDEKVNLTTLNLESSRHCVLGQVFDEDARSHSSRAFVDGFVYAYVRLLDGNEDNETFNLGFDHTADADDGLAYDGATVTYKELDEAWGWLITARRNQREAYESYTENIAFSGGYEEGYVDGQLSGMTLTTVMDIVDRMVVVP